MDWQANHFVTSYAETPDEGNIPDGYIFLAKKNFLGTAGQVQLNYFFENQTSLSLGYLRDMHQKERDYYKRAEYNTVLIEDWAIRHNNNIYFIKHKRPLSNVLQYHFGLFILYPEQQEIVVWESDIASTVLMDERDKWNSNLNEGGVLAGIDYEKQVDSKFFAGLHLSGYYVLSAQYYESTYLTGSLSYTLSYR